MMGCNATGMRAGNQVENKINGANLGLYYLAAQDVFRIAEDSAHADISIGVSLFEIYGGKLLDLLNARNPVRCLEDSRGKVCFPGLSEHPGEFNHLSVPEVEVILTIYTTPSYFCVVYCSCSEQCRRVDGNH